MTGELLAERYRLQELIGRGAAAGVYRAADEALGREVALKVYTKEGGEQELLARQEAEIRILASLIHPGLVTLFDAGSDPAAERSFVVMEYVNGPDLRRHLQEGPLDAAGIASMGADLASALDYVHGRGVIHRDIKPGNVLLYKPRPWEPDCQWRAKLADFGIARVMEEEHLTGTGRTVGTAAYLSPEQALGEPLDGASDVYSLGLVLLECFTRHVEFPGSQVESGVARLNRDPVIPDSVGPEWQALLAAMTARHPADRPSPAEAANALQQLARQAPVVPVASVATAVAVPVRPADVPASSVHPPYPSRPPQQSPASQQSRAARRQRRKLGKRARTAVGAGVAMVLLAGAASATFGGDGTNRPAGTAAEAGPIVPVQNNPVDFHLDQLEAAVEPSTAFKAAVWQIRDAVFAGDPQAALGHLDRLEKAVADEAAGGGLTFDQFRTISESVRLVRIDLRTLITASEGQAVEALPSSAPDSVPAADPLPAIVVEAAPDGGGPAPEAGAGEPAAEAGGVSSEANAGPNENSKTRGKPDDPSGKGKG